jgi:tRNA(adenine34) deaminase
VFDVVSDERLNHRVRVEKGVLEAEAAQMLREFFRAKRSAEL